MNFKINYTLCVIPLGIILTYFGISTYRKNCNYLTFKNIDKNFKQKEIWEKDLDIYSVSMPNFYTKSPKKQKCVLLIGGYKDIPYVWNEIQKYFINDKIDYYAPRTYGNGRSYYQISDWKDWVITYIEAIYILQEQYETINIIGFSTGCVIALYLTQFKFNCKIDNLFLCAPFIINKRYWSTDLFFSSNIFSKILNRLYAWTFRFYPKFNTALKGCRDTSNEYYLFNDFFEIYGDIEMNTVLFEFIKFRPKSILVKNIIILYPNNDNIIGDINEQCDIISKIYKKKINAISIPSYLNNKIVDNNLPDKCRHVMFKEKQEIIENIYYNMKKYLI